MIIKNVYLLPTFLIATLLMAGCGVKHYANHATDENPQTSSAEAVEQPTAAVEPPPLVDLEESLDYQKWNCATSINQGEAISTPVVTSLSGQNKEQTLNATPDYKVVFAANGDQVDLQLKSIATGEIVSSSSVRGTTGEIHFFFESNILGSDVLMVDATCNREFLLGQDLSFLKLQANSQEVTYLCRRHEMELLKKSNKKDKKQKLLAAQNDEFQITMKADELEKPRTVMFNREIYTASLMNDSTKAGLLHLQLDTSKENNSIASVNMTADAFETTFKNTQRKIRVVCERQ